MSRMSEDTCIPSWYVAFTEHVEMEVSETVTKLLEEGREKLKGKLFIGISKMKIKYMIFR